MDRIRQLRQDWARAEALERQIVSDTTAEERVNQLIEMYRIFKPHLDETEELFGPERRQALAELQAKLFKAAERRKSWTNSSAP